MNNIKPQFEFDPHAVLDILTLRYAMIKKPPISCLTWSKFKNINNESHNHEENIERLLRSNIKKRFRKSSPKISIALSSGVDSTLLLALLKKTLPDARLIALTAQFPNSIDETSQARIIAEKFDIEHKLIKISNILQDLPKAISILKLPFWDIHWYYLIKEAQLHSSFLVSGDGGDELFGGYVFRYKKFLSELKNKMSPLEKTKLYLKCHERDWVPNQEELFGEKLHFSWNRIYSLLMPYFNNSLSPLEQVFLADFNGKLIFNSIPANNQFCKYFDVEPVRPFLSHTLIHYAAQIPSKLKYDKRKNMGKIQLRALLDKQKPHLLKNSVKNGFSVNTTNLWQSSGHELCYSYLIEGRIVNDKLIDKEWLVSSFRKLETDLDVRYVNKFLGLLALEIWYRLFVTKEMKSTASL